MDALRTQSGRAAPVVTESAVGLWRLTGLVPLTLFVLTAWRHLGKGQPHELLWVCNIANLLVAVGILAWRERLLQVGSIWILAGSCWWFYDSAAYGQFEALQVATHAGTATIAVLLQRTPRTMHRPGLLRALAFALVLLAPLQLLSRVTSPSMANVNFAFEGYYGLWSLLPRETPYAVVWPVLAALGVASCSAACLLLSVLLQPCSPSRRLQTVSLFVR